VVGAKSERFARTHAHAPEVDVPFLLKHGLDYIVGAHRNPGRTDQQIDAGVQANLQLGPYVIFGIARHTQEDEIGAKRLHLRGLSVAVAIADLTGLQRRFHVDEFVAGGQDAHAGPGVHLHLTHAQAGQYADFLRPDQVPGSHDLLSDMNVFADVTYIGARLYGAENADFFRQGTAGVAPRFAGVFDGDDGIGALGHGRAGHDPRRHAGRERHVWNGAGGANCKGAMIDNGYNLPDDGSCGFSGTSANNATLNLGPLSGGVFTPQAGSEAIGAVPNGIIVDNNGVTLACNGTANDQLGSSRPINAGTDCTSGAVEVALTLSAPTITTQPQDQTIFSGQTATLTVVASGSDLSYQWYQGSSGVT